MKILNIILDGFPTFRPDVAALWGKYLPLYNVTCDISTVQNKETAGSDWNSGAIFAYKVHKNKILEQLGAFVHDCRVLWITRREHYDAIQVRDKAFICLIALGVARLRGVPFFYWMSFPIAESLVRLASTVDRKGNFIRWVYLMWRGRLGSYLLYKYVFPRCDHIFVQSERMLQDLVARGVSAEKMTAVPMCIDPDRFKQPLPFSHQNIRMVGYLGECSSVRRVDFLLEALAIVKQTFPDIQMLIVGDAYEQKDREMLAEAIARLDIKHNVRITGWLPAKEALVEFAKVEVALALMAPDPLLDSTTPTKLVEYLAMGRPVVANSHPDQSVVLSQSAGGVSVPFDVNAYADAIVSLLKNVEASQLMAKSGREWVMLNRNYNHMAKFLSDQYYYLCNKDRIESTL
ncbi:MAG TPA: glycosyltransferase [Methylophilaceae bacterium]|jgi:glycosyltransferase involved in cell wall biosynthesis